jgi:hypothetical protein
LFATPTLLTHLGQDAAWAEDVEEKESVVFPAVRLIVHVVRHARARGQLPAVVHLLRFGSSPSIRKSQVNRRMQRDGTVMAAWVLAVALAIGAGDSQDVTGADGVCGASAFPKNLSGTECWGLSSLATDKM